MLAGLAYDGLVAYRRVPGVAGATLVGGLATRPPSAEPGRAHLRLHPATRHPLLRRDAGQAGRLPRVDGALPGRAQLATAFPPYFNGIVGARRCISEAARCDLSRGIESDAHARTITVHLTAPDPEFLHKLTMPFAYVVPPGTPAHATDRGFAPPGTGPYRIAGWDVAPRRRARPQPALPADRRAARPGSRIGSRSRSRGSDALETHTAAIERGGSDLTWLADFPLRGNSRTSWRARPASCTASRCPGPRGCS